MTGLLTKTATERRVRQMRRENRGRFYAFFILDIDDFKQVNDQFGHAFGDEIIRNFTQTLSWQFRNDDVIGRIGGDEFVFFVQAPDRSWAQPKAYRIVTTLNKPCPEAGISPPAWASLLPAPGAMTMPIFIKSLTGPCTPPRNVEGTASRFTNKR